VKVSGTPTIKTQESIVLADRELSGDREDAMRDSRQAEPPEEELPERGSPVEVQQALYQEKAAREAGDEELPEQGSPVEVQQALHQEEAAREAGDEELPEQGSPVEVQQALHQEEAAREAGDEELPEQGSLWRSSRRHNKRRLAGRLAPRTIQNGGPCGVCGLMRAER
jgi:hypothetical protein